ncbi:YihY/virulence factor BrkB family protein [Sphingobium sp. RSMS]|uniref:YihY/virulence factor BrkB family protein n=1 Tax=Sphingobium sp. RSMS TaxID=520734 RepID=UPI0010F57D85|nr:YihY/virulence factor BrkB family protein [Sphingobium sp. RSMS]UXC91486.1 YihY/virulence factor BrkB family protein [Sphingobium sp. RSMS]
MSVSHKRSSAAEKGATADTPRQMNWAGWKPVLKRIWVNSGRHNVSLLSAGVAFFAFLSFVPLLGAVVMTYGLIADPGTVAMHMRTIIDLVPADAARLIYEQLTQLTQSATDKKGIGLLVALLISIYGASRASGAMIGSLNIIYEQEDRRSLVRSYLVAAALAGAAVLVGIIGLLAASMLSFTEGLVEGIGPVGASAVQALTWLVAASLCSSAIGGMYRFAPDRADARWQWLSVGSCAATLLWLLATLGFGLYASWFGDYDATYGSLGAVVVLLMWLYVSAYAVLLGGVINAETERQTARDTTTGPEEPMGQRGAAMADTSAALQQ